MDRHTPIDRHPTIAIACLVDALSAGLQMRIQPNVTGDKCRVVLQKPATSYGSLTTGSTRDTLAEALFVVVRDSARSGWTGVLSHTRSAEKLARRADAKLGGSDKLMHPELAEEVQEADRDSAWALGRVEEFVLHEGGVVTLLPSAEATEADSFRVLMKADLQGRPIAERAVFITSNDDVVSLLSRVRG